MPARAGRAVGREQLDEEFEEEDDEEFDEEDEAELEAAEHELLGRGVRTASSASVGAARESTIVTVLPPGTPAPVAVSKTFVRPVTAVPSAIAGAANDHLPAPNNTC